MTLQKIDFKFPYSALVVIFTFYFMILMIMRVVINDNLNNGDLLQGV